MSLKCGILLLDKPSGATSHDMVDLVRRKFSYKKVGHAGTLDPMATGLLIILLGAFTKKSSHFSMLDKEYEARLCLGISTDTADRLGKIVEKKDTGFLTNASGRIEEVFKTFAGEIQQVPPMYSAKKIKGKKLYEFARKGIEVAREPKTVFIQEIKITYKAIPFIKFYVKCSKGTYVRQLAHDIGDRIGCGAHLDFLRRTKIGSFAVENALSFEKLKCKKTLTDEDILQLS